MDVNGEELKLVDYQLIISGVVLVMVILSLVLGYNLHLKLKGEKPILSEEESKKIAMFVKIIGLLTAIAAIYVSVKSVTVAKAKGENLRNAYLEVGASALALISSIIVIIVVLNDGNNDFLDILNPEI
ncbi:MAG: hypothetical protein PHG03_01320 [Bacilli bacterium]|nr:hypothetical protein [Bacilli bacterium]MDD4795186.1 hypothetical protein [Bacilli bacterium]